jgi:hypothetical protein
VIGEMLGVFAGVHRLLLILRTRLRTGKVAQAS